MSDQEEHPPPTSPGVGPGAPLPADSLGSPGPPPPEAPPPAPLPWEQRAQIGFVPALVQTVQLFAAQPRQAFDRARRSGDFGSPLLWVVLVGVLMGIVSWIFSMMFITPVLNFLPPEIRGEVGPLMASGIVGGGVFHLFFSPIGAVVGTFLWSVIAHVCLMVVAGGSWSGSGFEGTFRASAYSQVAQIANVVPFVGGLIAVVWGLILVVIGMSSMHKLSTGTAVLVVVLPGVLFCAFVAAAAMAVFALIGMARA